jgi:sugar lactone lactonase YvrE
MYCCLTSKIIKITPSGTTLTIVGTGTAGYSGDGGPAINAKINGAKGLAFDATGNIYFADQNNYRIRKIDLAGNISTITGNGGSGYSGDGGPAISAQIGSARGIAIDVAGNIFIAESTRIRKINAAGIISTIAQNMNSTTGVTIDASGNIFFSTLNQINKINSIGLITTIAGNTSTGFSGDGGPAINCKLWWPDDLEFNSQGNLYVADTHNNRIRLICFNSCAVGVNELDNSNKNQLSIYPNPSNNKIQVNSDADFNRIEIVNNLGQLIISQENAAEVSVKDLSNGIYFIHLFDAQNKLLATKKFIKE